MNFQIKSSEIKTNSTRWCENSIKNGIFSDYNNVCTIKNIIPIK